MKKLFALVASTLALAACTDTTAPDLTPTVEAAKTALDATAAVSFQKSRRIATN